MSFSDAQAMILTVILTDISRAVDSLEGGDEGVIILDFF
jgi:hypothetical protein